MTDSSTRCPKCGGSMEPGFLLDKAHGNVPTEAEWMEGEPVVGYWTGLKTKGRERLPVRTDRCTGCGYLESFAKPA